MWHGKVGVNQLGRRQAWQREVHEETVVHTFVLPLPTRQTFSSSPALSPHELERASHNGNWRDRILRSLCRGRSHGIDPVALHRFMQLLPPPTSTGLSVGQSGKTGSDRVRRNTLWVHMARRHLFRRDCKAAFWSSYCCWASIGPWLLRKRALLGSLVLSRHSSVNLPATKLVHGARVPAGQPRMCKCVWVSYAVIQMRERHTRRMRDSKEQ